MNMKQCKFSECMILLKVCFLSQQQTFAITTADRITVHYGPRQISIDHIHTDYMTYYVGGLPAQLRQR